MVFRMKWKDYSETTRINILLALSLGGAVITVLIRIAHG